eukprot:CAMPEP_0197018096 /NCGR_PEP_ID=MMETSP1380-20130617/79908_1 /TAXON_ID=5936 /ORGANISM="Euplotes crassus, Strain CT5" /LENGTH=93 /DNA_ID=CAMNT_0042445269 /DNA_START=479 /DNA_END=760 /DNA_ORIENTATION=-
MNNRFFLKIYKIVNFGPKRIRGNWKQILAEVNEDFGFSFIANTELEVSKQAKELRKKFENYFMSIVSKTMRGLGVAWNANWDPKIKKNYKMFK